MEKGNKRNRIIIALVILLIVIIAVINVTFIFNKLSKLNKENQKEIINNNKSETENQKEIIDNNKLENEEDIKIEEVKISEEKYYLNISKVDENRKVLWTYKTEEGNKKQYETVYLIKTTNDTAYVAENSRIVVLNLVDGNVKWKKEIKDCELPRVIFDSKDNLYCIGEFTEVLYKIDKNGNIIKKIQIEEELGSEKSLYLNFDESKLYILCMGNNNIELDLSSLKYKIIDNKKYKDLIEILNLCVVDVNLDNAYVAFEAYCLVNSEKYLKEDYNNGNGALAIPKKDAQNFMKVYFGKKNFDFTAWKNVENFNVESDSIIISDPPYDWEVTELFITEIVENEDNTVTLYTDSISGIGGTPYTAGKAKINLEVNGNNYYLKSFVHLEERSVED